ncbi:MAG: hypothetical protein J0I06_24580 [Planctomycetes bacterium]|nr:hypothetical protein [Planctomycetota bacterium]
MLVWNAHKSKVRHLAFSPDGARLASAAEKAATVRLWEPTTGRKLGELPGRWGFTSGVAFSPDGKRIATTTMNFRVAIWDAEARRPLAVAAASQTRYGPAFAPDGSCVAATGWAGVAVWRDPAVPHPETLGPYADSNWGPDERFEFDGKDYVVDKFDSLAFSPDGRLVAANGIFRAVVWDRATRAVHRVVPHDEVDALSVVSFSPDGRRLAIGFGKAAEIHPLKGKGRRVVLTGHTMAVRAIGFAPDGRTAVTASSDGTVRFWDAATGAPTRTFDWGIGRVYGAALSPDGLTCAAGGEKGQIVVWDVDA